MGSSLVLTAALLAPAAPVPPDAAPNVTGPAPRVLALKADASGTVRLSGTSRVRQTVTVTQIVMEGNKQVAKQVEQDVLNSLYFNKTLAELNGTFATAAGRRLTLDEATARIKGGATVLASSDGKPVAAAWLKAVDPDTVVVTAEGLGGAHFNFGNDPSPTTATPQLAMLGTDARGTVLAPVTSAPGVAGGAVYYNEFDGNVQGLRGRRFVAEGGGVYYGVNMAEAKVVTKPLPDVKFEAYDRAGKLVPRGEALKRLAAGGLVVVAGDARVPDEAYLKAFRDDVLVLVGPELVLPLPVADQTKKKGDQPKADAPVGQPVPAPAVRPLPAVRPVIKPAVLPPANGRD
jgi:hypothetical protein